MSAEPCDRCNDEGTNEGRFCSHCEAGEKAEAAYYEAAEREFGWMRSYARAYHAARRMGDDETAEVIDRMMRS